MLDRRGNPRQGERDSLMQRDVRATSLWAEVREFYLESQRGQFGRWSAVAEPAASPDGSMVAFTGSGLDSLDEPGWRRVYLLHRGSGEVRQVSPEGHDAYTAAWSGTGRWIAFLSGAPRQPATLSFYEPGSGRLCESGAVLPYGVDGAAWSASEDRVLIWSSVRRPELGTVARTPDAAWMPAVRSTADRGAQHVVAEVPGGEVKEASVPGLWIWEAAWVDDRSYLALASEDGEIPNWYEARLFLCTIGSEDPEEVHRPHFQAGHLSTSPDGRAAAWIEGLASDRGMIAGSPVVMDVASRQVRRQWLEDWEITDVHWRDAGTVAYLGLDGTHTVGGDIATDTLQVEERWRTTGTCGMPMPSGSPEAGGGLVVAYEDWTTPPTIRLVGEDPGDQELVPPAMADGLRWLRGRKGTMSTVEWESDDGAALSGLLITPPEGRPPYPLVVNVHGGPVWAWRNNWDIVFHTPVALLVSRGFAVLNPNGRGSIGRGPAFVELILGAMGGKDLADYTSAASTMVERGIAQRDKLSVIGHSYGGFMACSLAAGSDLFAAAVAVSPVSEWVSQHYVSAIPGFDDLFVGHLDGPEARSPIGQVAGLTTPTLVIGCEDDDCTPVGQAIGFYRAIAEHGRTDAALVVYPSEGHGVRGWPALVDQSVRMVDWLERYAR